MEESGILAVGTAEFSVVLLVVLIVVVPIAAIAFARSGRGYDEIGKGQFAVDFDEGGETSQEDEVRQLVEAKAYRQSQRGEDPLDVEAEIDRLLTGRHTGDEAESSRPAFDPETAAIREEIRQVVVAGNERRERRGEEPLDVEAEVDRMFEEFG